LVGAPKRREGVKFLVERNLSQRQACALLHISPSSLRYRVRSVRRQKNGELVEHLKRFAYKKLRAGYRSAWQHLRRLGESVNHKRVYRLWKQAGLSLRHRTRRRKRTKPETGADPLRATHPGQVWTYDFVTDHCFNGRKLKILNVVDEFTRECLAIQVETRLPSNKVKAVLERLFREHGAPEYLRSDNGPEFVEKALRKWLKEQGTKTVYIDKGCPWQNGYVESFNGRFRDEYLNQQVFVSLPDAQVRIGSWRREYNEERPHSSLKYRTPLEFKRAWAANPQESSTGQLVLLFQAGGD
jgi:putative transposase